MSTSLTHMSNTAAAGEHGYLANVATAARAFAAALIGARPGPASQAASQEWTPEVSHFQSNHQQMPNLSAELRFLASRG
jgi:hypothetical protein